MAKHILDEDLVRVWGPRKNAWTGETKNGVIALLFWGDEIELSHPADNTASSKKEVRVRVHDYYSGTKRDGVIRKKKKSGKFTPLRFRAGANKHLLEVTFVDVQQGDATVIRTPDRRLILVDGGEQKFIARYLASQFPNTTAAKPLDIDALVITHGDADHFKGLIELANARDHQGYRNLHARVRRYFHNGLVKGPSSKKVAGKNKSVPDKELFGTFKKVGNTTFATQLWSDPRDASRQNQPFQDWLAAFERMIISDSTVIDRIEFGEDQVFDFLRPGVDIEVLGPVVEEVAGKPALPFLGGTSASHTINGHSIVLRLRHGNVHLLLGGDLNHHAEERIRERIEHDNDRTLRSEILKVPHHGSHEFEQAFLDQVNPVVSVVSSGDENPGKEYVHPRANLMAALGRASRGPEPLVYSTELAAFFAYRGFQQPEQHRKVAGQLKLKPKSQQRPGFHAFERLVWGAVRVRTDGERVVTAVESASSNVKEAYAFHVDVGGNVTRDEVQVI